MSILLSKLGWVRLPQNRSLLLCVPNVAACPYVSHVVSRWRKEQPRTSFFLAQHLAEPLVLLPINSAPTSLLFLLLARVRIIISIEHPFWLPARLLAKAYDMGVPIIVARCRPLEKHHPVQHRIRLSRLIDWWEPVDRAAAQQIGGLGVPADRIANPSNTEAGPSTQSWAMLKQLSARRPPVRRPLQRMVLAGLDSPLWRKIIAKRAGRVETVEDFRRELGFPQSILCLGNGPSCEDPALGQHTYDALFRVNHRWISRGKFIRPDVVFTGQKRTLFSVHPSFFAFQTRRAEAQLVTHHIFNPLCRPMSYVTLERLGVLSGESWDRMRPTNGATMLAAAVALKPQKLVIGGIDLFEDPAGAYPGDSATPNAYVAVHDPEDELNFMLETLDRFEGELVIIGDVLNQKWKDFKSNVE
jgi:hypothetical protein